MTWQERAVCLRLTPLFYAEDPVTIHQACAVCASCPVRAECLADAIASEEGIKRLFGVRGGLSAGARLRRRRGHGLD